MDIYNQKYPWRRFKSNMSIPPDGLSDEDVIEIYRNSRRIAVIGMSRNPEKPANYVPMFLKEKGYEIIPVNPVAEEIMGMKAYKRLEDIPGEIDVVDVFRPSEEVPDIVKSVLEKGAKVLWLQEGIYHPDAEKARMKGLKVVWNRCMMREYKRLFSD